MYIKVNKKILTKNLIKRNEQIYFTTLVIISFARNKKYTLSRAFFVKGIKSACYYLLTGKHFLVDRNMRRNKKE